MKYIWGSLRTLRTLLFIGVLAASLGLNVAMFIGGSIYAAASSAFEVATGYRTVASRHAAEVAELTTDLDAERRARRELQGEVAGLSDNLVSERRLTRELQSELAGVSDELVNERAVARRLQGEAAGLSDELLLVRRQLDDEAMDFVTYRGRKVAVAEAVEETADLISERARKSATREIGSMAGEALPWLGTAVIVGVTTLELKDLCDRLKDMNALKQAFNPALALEDGANTVCSMKVPTRQELWATVKASPRTAWDGAKARVDDLPSLDEMELPDIDWAGYWSGMGTRFHDYYEASSERSVILWIQTKERAGETWKWMWGREKEAAQEQLVIE